MAYVANCGSVELEGYKSLRVPILLRKRKPEETRFMLDGLFYKKIRIQARKRERRSPHPTPALLMHESMQVIANPHMVTRAARLNPERGSIRSFHQDRFRRGTEHERQCRQSSGSRKSCKYRGVDPTRPILASQRSTISKPLLSYSAPIEKIISS